MHCQSVFTCDAKGITGCQGKWRGLFIFSFGNITQPGCYYRWTNIEKFCTNIYTLLIKYWKDSQILCWMSINIVYNLSFGNNTQTGCYYRWTNIEKFCTNIYTLLIKYWKDSQILCWMSINIVYNLSFGNNTQTGCY